MSQFKNLYETKKNLDLIPIGQQAGTQQQTNYNNALTIYNNYLNSVAPVYSTIWDGSPASVTNSGIYQILQFNTTQNINFITTKDTKLNMILVVGGGSGACCTFSSQTTYGAGGGAGGTVVSYQIIQPANTNRTYHLTIGAGGVPAVNDSYGGNMGGQTSISNDYGWGLNASGGGFGYSDQSTQALTYDCLYLSAADGVDQTSNTVKVISLCDGVIESIKSISALTNRGALSQRYGGTNNNNICDLPDGYTVQIGPSFIRYLGGGGGCGSTVVPSTISNNSKWGGGAGGYWSTISGLAQSGLANTGGGGGGERAYKNSSYQSNNASGGSGTIIIFFENDTISTPIQNNTNISNCVETESTSKGNYKYGLLNNFVFNPINNIGLLNVTLSASIQSIVATNNTSTNIKNSLIKSNLFYSYLPNGSPNNFYIDYTLDPNASTNYKATGHNFLFNPFTTGTNSIYYGNLYIIIPPTATNRIYTYNFYAISRYNAHNTLIIPSTINVNGSNITLYGYNNVTFPATNTYITQKISVISSTTTPLSFFAFTTIQCLNITDLSYVAPSGPSAVLNSLSTNGYNSCVCAFGCSLLNSNYTGPIIQLRASGGTSATCDFYGDTSGNLTTGFNGTGTTLATWLTTQGGATTYAFVPIWYNQSVNSTNNAHNVTGLYQPIYDVSNKLINFGYTGGGGGVASPHPDTYFDLPNGSFPINDSSYTYVFKSWNVNTDNLVGGSFFNGGGAGGNNSMYISTNNGFELCWGNNALVTSSDSFTTKNVISTTYSSGSGGVYFFKNGSSTYHSLGGLGSRTQTSIYNTIGQGTITDALDGQMYYLYAFNSSLSSGDRVLVEAT